MELLKQITIVILVIWALTTSIIGTFIVIKQMIAECKGKPKFKSKESKTFTQQFQEKWEK